MASSSPQQENTNKQSSPIAAQIPLQVSPNGKTIKVGVQLKDEHAVEAAVSAGMLRQLVQGRFGQGAQLTTVDGQAIPDNEIIWSRELGGDVHVHPHLHVSNNTQTQPEETTSSSSPQKSEMKIQQIPSTDISQQQQQQQNQHRSASSPSSAVAQKQRQLQVAQALLETDRGRWTSQLEVLRQLRDISLQVLQTQRGTLASRAGAEMSLEEIAQKLSDEQRVLRMGAPMQEQRRAEVQGAEQALAGLQDAMVEALDQTGVNEKPQHAEAPAYLRDVIFNLAMRRVQLATTQENIERQQQLLEMIRQERRALVEDGEASRGHVRVVVRQRPHLAPVDDSQPKRLGASEVGEVIAAESDRVVRVFSPATGQKEFEFVRVLNSTLDNKEQQQLQLFDEEVVPQLREAITEGTDATVLCWGPTSSGKSYTVFGSADGQSPGILELALAEIVSFAGDADIQASELYLDNKVDLLDGWIRVKSVDDGLKLVRRAAQRRVTARTLTNDVSSRSHMIVGIRFPTVTGKTVTVQFCDLAGSERVSRSLSTGDRLREAQHINKSLSALGDVVAALSSGAQYIPYRNSKLTMMLQQALGGASRTLLVVCVPPHLPDQHNLSEIVSTLTFASRSRGIVNKRAGSK